MILRNEVTVIIYSKKIIFWKKFEVVSLQQMTKNLMLKTKKHLMVFVSLKSLLKR